MRGVARGGPRLHVAREAYPDRDAFAPHFLGQDRVLNEMRCVTDAPRAAIMNRLAHGLRPKTFAGMAGARRAMSLRELERLLVILGGEPLLATREVEADDPLPPEIHGELGERDRFG